MKYAKFLIIFFFTASIFSQNLYENRAKQILHSGSAFQDSVTKKTSIKKSISAVFLGVGGGISIPASPFKNNSAVTFGILGRLEFSSTTIFPFVVGGEVTYFSYGGTDQFKTVNTLTNFVTRVLGYGLNIEYSLTKLFPSSFTMPFLTMDVKNNSIKREYDANKTYEDLPRKESKISVGAGIGFTMFVLDFHIKYNYLKNSSNIGVYAKMKFPVIRF